jgi:hypothetical protein
MLMKKSSDTIGNRTRDLPVRNAVPQPLRHRVPLDKTVASLLHFLFAASDLNTNIFLSLPCQILNLSLKLTIHI